MAILGEPWKCYLGHVHCQLHTQTKPDLASLPGPDGYPHTGVCFHGCVSTRLWFAPHKGGRWYCRRHLRHALKAGGYPIPIED